MTEIIYFLAELIIIVILSGFLGFVIIMIILGLLSIYKDILLERFEDMRIRKRLRNKKDEGRYNSKL